MAEPPEALRRFPSVGLARLFKDKSPEALKAIYAPHQVSGNEPQESSTSTRLKIV